MATKNRAKHFWGAWVVKFSQISLVIPQQRNVRVVLSSSESPSLQTVDGIEDYLQSLPSVEPWLDKNPTAKASVERGLQQASGREIHYLGSFAQFSDLEVDD